MGGATVIMNNDVLVLVRKTIAESASLSAGRSKGGGADSARKIDWRGLPHWSPMDLGKSDFYFLLYSSSDDYCEIVQGKSPMLARSGALCSGLNSRFWGTYNVGIDITDLYLFENTLDCRHRNWIWAEKCNSRRGM